jgi:L-ascorbate metabolism protein UlaG (beta-lactamase superfamily)
VFELTALGNHSWLVEAGGTRLLIDPTLTQRYGPTPAQGVEIFPPREIDVASMPAIDAVYISHEHEGHFELPSLALLDRRARDPARDGLFGRARPRRSSDRDRRADAGPERR